MISALTILGVSIIYPLAFMHSGLQYSVCVSVSRSFSQSFCHTTAKYLEDGKRHHSVVLNNFNPFNVPELLKTKQRKREYI